MLSSKKYSHSLISLQLGKKFLKKVAEGKLADVLNARLIHCETNWNTGRLLTRSNVCAVTL